MPHVHANGIDIAYEAHGDPANPPLLLIMGLGAQLTLWPIELVEDLVRRGYYVIRHDNRDIGLSTKFTEHGVPNFRRVALMRAFGLRAKLPYRLTEMAADAVALLDALGIAKAHVVGASMGGMIAQLVAIGYPDRVLSLTSIMSTTGNRRLPQAKPEALAALMDRPPPNATLEQVIPFGVRISKAIGSPGYPADETRLKERIARDYQRSFHPTGPGRQLAAILDDGDRRKRLRGVTAPSLVIHGADDPLVPVEGGRDTAAAIPGARLKVIPGMGHDLPLELVDEVAGAIAEIAR
ncbi:MAG: alpha/beta hydrolase [Sphingomonadales bacterium]|nr:alpha/beta hydrolase [Sphingomonadales bacterium]